MGFKYRLVKLTAGNENFPVGDTDALRRTRSESIVKECALALIDCNVGWQLDTSKNQTVDDFTDIPCRTGSKTYPALFFVNSVSNCKLFIAYFGDEVSNYGIKNFSGNDIFSFYSNSSYVGGLCVSIIPEGSNSSFGDPTTTSFLPSEATRIFGTAFRNDTLYTNGYNPESGNTSLFAIWTTPYVICVAASNSNGNMQTPGFAIGRIFGTLANQEDNYVNAKYGLVSFRVYPDSSSTYEGWYTTIAHSATLVGSSIRVPGVDMSSSSIYTQPCCGCILKSDGTWLNGTDRSTRNIVLFIEGCEQLSNKMFNSSNGKSRWLPMSMASVANDLSTYGVVSGDGFKGYLDTDLFRCALGVLEQTFDNGNFICPESNHNWLFGWDASNPPLNS